MVDIPGKQSLLYTSRTGGRHLWFQLEPSPGKKPQPIGGDYPVTLPVVTIAVLCFLFILYRRAAAIRQVIAVKYVVFHTGFTLTASIVGR